VLSFLLLYINKIIDFKRNMGFEGSFNLKYLRMKTKVTYFIAFVLTSYFICVALIVVAG